MCNQKNKYEAINNAIAKCGSVNVKPASSSASSASLNIAAHRANAAQPWLNARQ